MKKRIRNLPFFDPDSKPMQVLGAFADMIVLNVCFLIGCLPVVTVGASMSALYAAASVNHFFKISTVQSGNFFNIIFEPLEI